MIYFKNLTIAQALEKVNVDTALFCSFNEENRKWAVCLKTLLADLESAGLPAVAPTPKVTEQATTIAIFDAEYQAQQFMSRIAQLADEISKTDMTPAEYMQQFDNNGEEIIQINMHLTALGVEKMHSKKIYGYLLHADQRDWLVCGDNLLTINFLQLSYLYRIAKSNNADIALNPV